MATKKRRRTFKVVLPDGSEARGEQVFTVRLIRLKDGQFVLPDNCMAWKDRKYKKCSAFVDASKADRRAINKQLGMS